MTETKAFLRAQIKVLEARLSVLRLAGYRDPVVNLGVDEKRSAGAIIASQRMVKMTPEERSEVARNAVNVRWNIYRARKASMGKKRKAA